jgi:hypothetical protein
MHCSRALLKYQKFLIAFYSKAIRDGVKIQIWIPYALLKFGQPG